MPEVCLAALLLPLSVFASRVREKPLRCGLPLKAEGTPGRSRERGAGQDRIGPEGRKGDQAFSRVNPPAHLEITNSEDVDCCCCSRTRTASSGSSDVDVRRTRIPAYDDDENSVLYAYEPHTAYVHNRRAALSDTSYDEEQRRSVQDLLTHCQVIHDTVQNLDKKFDALRGKVAKIHRLHVKSLWQSRKPLRSAYRNYNYLPSRRNRCRKTKKKKDTCSLFSEPKSYSPTVPVRRPNTDYQYDFLDTTYPSEQESPERDPELIYQEWEMRMNQSQSPPADSTAEPSQPGCTPNLVQGDYLGTPCRGSPRAHSSASLLSPKEPSTGMPETPVTQAYPSPPYNPEVTAHLSSLENHSFGHIDADFRNPGNFVTSTPIVNNPGMPYNFPDDPSTWSVNEVVQFLEQADPQTLGPVADIFRQHEIDGKALLLLKSDMMLNYMGLKLGITVKVCHHIDRLRGQKYINN